MMSVDAAGKGERAVAPLLPPAAVLFDLDEMLLPDLKATDAALLATCRGCRQLAGMEHVRLVRSVREQAQTFWRAGPLIAYCQAVGISSWEGLWGDFSGPGAELAALRDWVPAYRQAAWQQALAAHGLDSPDLADALALAFPAQRRDLLVAYDETPSVLATLRDHCRLGLVTNGAPALQREKLERAGLARWFDVVVVSGDLGIGKPDPAPFHAALNPLGLAPGDAMMVGDSLERDVLGAQRAGLRAIWLDRADRGMDGGAIIPDWRIGRLAELPAALGVQIPEAMVGEIATLAGLVERAIDGP